MDHNPDLSLTRAQCEAAANLLKDLKLEDIARACGVDISEPFDSEGTLRRLMDAVQEKEATPRSVLSVFRTFPKDDRMYAAAESIASHYLRNYVEVQYASERENKKPPLIIYLRTFLYDTSLNREVYEYIVDEICSLGKQEKNMSFLRSAYEIAKERLPEDHKARLKLFEAIIDLGNVLLLEHKNDAAMLHTLWCSMPLDAACAGLRDMVVHVLLILAKKEEKVKILETIVANYHETHSLNREAAIALVRTVLKREGVIAVIQRYCPFLRDEASTDTNSFIIGLIEPYIDLHVYTAIHEENTERLLEVWQILLTWKSDEARRDLVRSKLLEIAVKKKDISFLVKLYKLSQKGESETVVFKALIDLAVDMGHTETLRWLTKNAYSDDNRNLVIRARVAGLHKQGLLA